MNKSIIKVQAKIMLFILHRKWKTEILFLKHLKCMDVIFDKIVHLF